jgi:hypothetical protein
MGGPHKCLNCNRSKRGHEGPVDDECTLVKLEHSDGGGKFFEVSNSESEPEDTNPQPNGAQGGARMKFPINLDPKKSKQKSKREDVSTMAAMMCEMLHQMGSLSCSNQRVLEKLGSLVNDQSKLQAEVT